MKGASDWSEIDNISDTDGEDFDWQELQPQSAGTIGTKTRSKLKTEFGISRQ